MNIKKWARLLKKTADLIHKSKLKPEDLSKEMVQEHANYLLDTVVESYTDFTPDKKIGHKDETIISQIKENVFVFSGFKNYQQLKEISSLLLDADGNIRAFKDFYTDVKTVDKTYNKTYLEAEYQHATVTGQMISRWQSIQEDKEAAPYLEYSAVMDSHTREAHAALNGTIRKVDDAFWDTYYPPNGWNCRCDVNQHVDATETPSKEVPVPDKPLDPMFRNNAGKTGVVFPEKHPYFKVSKSIDKVVRSNVKDILKDE